jgi:hypothetical protein
MSENDIDITESTRLRPSTDTIAEEIDGELVILDLEADLYFSLNPVGESVWKAVKDGAALEGIVDRVLAEFEVERERAEADVIAFLEDAVDRGLLVKDET